jgi:hypothetical protein
MKLQSELLGKLHQLSAGDRTWILERLSAQERSQLLATLEPTVAPAEVTNTKPLHIEPKPLGEISDVVKALGRAEPRLVAAITRNEPAWLNAVIASAQHDSWSKAFIEALPASLRVEVERTQPWHFGAALTEAATRQILERCRGNVPVESPFERLVERLSTARSKRRMTLHL